MHKAPTTQAYAALTSELMPGGTAEAPKRIKVLPAGEFTAIDGRPGNMEEDGVEAKAWLLTPELAQTVIARFKAIGLHLPIDYEHQTLEAKTNGLPAPAAGWISALEFVPDDGLYAAVDWTAPGAARVKAKEYRYQSPVFAFDKVTGAVTALLHVAITNTPALNMLPELIAAASAQFALQSPRAPRTHTTEKHRMDKTAVCLALGLAATTSDETALTALSTLASTARSREQEITALKANQFDPVKHIPMEEHQRVVAELTTLRAGQEQAEHASLMTAALADARILPANQAYWAKQPLAALKEFLKDATPVAALSRMQTGGKPPAGGGTDASAASLSAEELAVCKSLGVTPEAYAKTKAGTTATSV